MSPNDACKVCFLALGGLVLVQGLSTMLGILAERPMFVATQDVSLPDVLSSIGVSSGIAAIGATLFSFVPGALILYKGPQWADRWFPEGDPDHRVAQPPSAYYAVGAAILGVYFIVAGAGSLAGGTVQAVVLVWDDDPIGYSLSFASRSLASGAAFLIAGFWLAAIGRRGIRDAA